MCHYGVVLDVCDFELSERDECHQIGLDVLLKQCLCLAVGLATHPTTQSRHSANFTSQIFPGKGGLASVILVLYFLLLFVDSGYVVQVIVLQVLELLFVDFLGFLFLFLEFGVLAFALLVVVLLAVAPGHHVFDLFIVGVFLLGPFGVFGHLLNIYYRYSIMDIIRVTPPSAPAKCNRCIGPLCRTGAYACTRPDSPPSAIIDLLSRGFSHRGGPAAVTLPRCFKEILRGRFAPLVLFFRTGGGGRSGAPFLGLR